MSVVMVFENNTNVNAQNDYANVADIEIEKNFRLKQKTVMKLRLMLKKS